jgi:pyruvate formate lyase activating enzyme
MKVKSAFYDKLEDSKVQCNICNHRCKIAPGRYGLCRARVNENGDLYSITYGQISSYNIDPIEKKPFYHFYPGSLAYSIGGYGCNMSCLGCQNYIISQKDARCVDTIDIMPEVIVKNALNSNSTSIAYTYNEPTVFLEYVENISKLARDKNLKNVFISNGYLTEESLEYILPYMDGINIDLKFINDSTYKDYSDASLDPILDNIKATYESKTHLEITNLVIDGLNSEDELIEELVQFIIDELGIDVPLHFSRAFPYYKLDIEPTNPTSIYNAYSIAKELGMEYVYLGNMPDGQNTYCPECGELLIKRNGYFTKDLGKIKNNKCVNCGKKLNFIMD